MKIHLVETLTGLYALDEQYEIQIMQTWPKDVKTIAKIMRRLREGDISIITDMVSEIESWSEAEVNSSNRALVDSLKEVLRIDYEENIEASRSLSSKLPYLAVKASLIDDESEYGEFSHNVLNEITRMDVHEKLSDREALLMPSVQLLGELDSVLNNLSNRMREWYGVHFPEMGNRVKEHEDYAKIITKVGFKESITSKTLMELSLKKKDAEKIEEASKNSVGADFDEIDMNILVKFSDELLELYQYRESLSQYVSMVSNEVAPNLSYIAGPILGAKLIEKAGGLKKLGMVPSSTIQVLGAEKAMFRAVTTRARPPKHGLLYQHPYVNSAPRDRRGNRARSLAAKIAIAARADLFSGDFIADDLASQLEDFKI